MLPQHKSLEKYLAWKEGLQAQSLEKYLTGKEFLLAPEFGKISNLEGIPTSARGLKSISPGRNSSKRQSFEKYLTWKGSPTSARVMGWGDKYLTGKEFLQAPEFGKVSQLKGCHASARVWKSRGATSARVWKSISPEKKSYQGQSLEKYLTWKEVLPAPVDGIREGVEFVDKILRLR
jgi:hypothetical protein